MNIYRTVYWSILLGAIAFAAVLEFVPALDGILEMGTTLEYGVQYAMICITLLAVYLALKLIKKNPVLRMSFIEFPALASIFCYHAFVNASFGYLALICLVAYIFVYPAKNDIEETNE